MRYKITLSYNGSAFSGWQIQSNAATVQGCIRNALKVLLHDDIDIVGAGRTDAGVNARNYAAHLDCGLPFEPEWLVCKLNAILPKEIVIHSIDPAADDFHARYSARLREYKYYVHTGKDPFDNEFSWRCPYSLDIQRMNRACGLLVGVHDCSCFEKTGSDNKSSICEIFSAGWEVLSLPEEQCGGKLVFTISANRFLRNMVRAITGTLIDIGRGRNEPDYINFLFQKGTRSDAGTSLPANALFFNRVEY